MTNTVGTNRSLNTTTRGRAWTSLVLGVLIFLVPFATGTTATNGDSSFAYSDYATGVVVVVLAAISIWAARSNMMALAWLEGVNALLGIWAIVAPFVFVNSGGAMAANIILGIILVIVAGWDAYVGMTNARGTTATRRGPVA
jgi:hypothetical protein